MKTTVQKKTKIQCFESLFKKAKLKCNSLTTRITLIFLSTLFLSPSLKALDIHMIKAPLDGPEIMKKYSIVRSVNDDGYVIAGSTPVNNFAGMAVNVMMIDDFGTVVWSYYYSFPGQAFEATHIDYNTANNGYVICGYTMRDWTTPFNPRPFVFEINNVGILGNNIIIDIIGAFVKIKPTPKGNYVAVGYLDGDTSIFSQKQAVCVKLNSTLTTILWKHGYNGVYPTLTYIPPEKFYEGIQGVYVTYDGVNETYVLGGNFTDSFMKDKTPLVADTFLVPIIDIREIDENGNIINQYHEKAYFDSDRSIDIIVQDVLVIEDQTSDYFGDIIMVGQEFNYSFSDPSNNLILARFKRLPIVRDSDYRRFLGLQNDPWYDSVRGNNLQYYNDSLFLFGTLERTDRQVPIMIKFLPDLPASSGSDEYNCTYLTDITPIIEAKYQGNRLLFPDHFGTASTNQNPNYNEQYYPHSLGVAHLDNQDNLFWAMVNIRKYDAFSTDYSLFLVSNIDNTYCFIDEDEIEFEKLYTTFINDYNVTSETVEIPGRMLTISTQAADFLDVPCSSNQLIWSSVEGIPQDSSNFLLFPNPANDHLQIQGAESGDRIEIWDVHGKRIISENQSNNPINIQKLTSGIYFAKVFRNNNTVFVGKFSKY